MIISPGRRFVFVHLHKCAGTSIEVALAAHLGVNDLVLGSTPEGEAQQAFFKQLTGLDKHASAQQAMDALGAAAWRDMYSFSFVREPIGRLRSLYTYALGLAKARPLTAAEQADLAATGRYPNRQPFRYKAVQSAVVSPDFSAFVLNPLTWEDPGAQPQWQGVCDADGQLLVNFVGRVEDMAQDWPVIEHRLGLAMPLGTENRSHVDRNVELTDAARQLLATRLARDFELFGYPPPLASAGDGGLRSYPGLVIHRLLELFNAGKGGQVHLAGPIFPDFAEQGRSRHWRATAPVDECPPPPKHAAAIVSLDEDFVYGGCLTHHFGHFVAEFVHRIVPSVRAFPQLRVIFVAKAGEASQPLPRWTQDILTHLGAGQRVLVVDTPVRVRCLHVYPQQEVLEGPPPPPAYLQALAQLQTQLPQDVPEGDCLFITRSGQGQGFAAEAVLDELFTRLGATLFAPEQHPVPVQLAMYLRHKRLLFSEGSALHALQLLGRTPAEVTVLARRAWHMGRNFLSPRVGALDYVNIRGGAVSGVMANGNPQGWSALVFVHRGVLADFCQRYFSQLPKPQVQAALDAAFQQLDALEFKALLAYLHANRHGKLFRNPAPVIQQIEAMQRYTPAQLAQCRASLAAD